MIPIARPSITDAEREAVKNVMADRWLTQGPMIERFEEADNIQARAALVEDSELWQMYYAAHPELEKQGRVLAKIPWIGTVGPRQDTVMIAAIMRTIHFLGSEEAVDGP